MDDVAIIRNQANIGAPISSQEMERMAKRTRHKEAVAVPANVLPLHAEGFAGTQAGVEYYQQHVTKRLPAII